MSDADGGNVQLGTYQIVSEQPLALYDTGYGKAYAVADHRDHPRGLYALVFPSDYPVRVESINQLRTLKNPAFQNCIKYGGVSWSGSGGRMAMVFEKPIGQKLVPDLSAPFAYQNEENIRRFFITPLLTLLGQLDDRGVHHGRLRLDTVYSTNGLIDLNLGECFSGPTGYDQPELFEPIERAMADQNAKGPGTITDDLYALAMCACLLSFGRNPFAGMDRATILRRRIDEGTLAMVLSEGKVPPGLLELVRGMLADHPKQRWTFDEISKCLEGQRLVQKASPVVGRSARALVIEGQDYWRARTVAMALAQYPEQAKALVVSGEMDNWLRRSLGDTTMADNLADFLKTIKIEAIKPELLACRMGLILDHAAPLRYNGITLMPGGFESVLVDIQQGRSAVPLATLNDLLKEQLLSAWYSTPGNLNPSLVVQIKQADQAQKFFMQSGLLGGIERVMYEGNRDLPCMSDIFKGAAINSLSDFIHTLEDMAARGVRPPVLIDKHSACYIAARFKHADQVNLRNLGHRDDSERNLAIIHILADIQDQHGRASLPHLSAMLADMARPTLDRFHSKKIRDDAAENLNRVAKKGNIRSILALIDNTQVQAVDEQGFKVAQHEYKMLVNEIARMQKMLDQKDAVGLATAQRNVVTLAMVLAGISAVMVLVLKGMS